MARRTKAVELDEKWRQRIRASMLRNRLRDHALGLVEMTATQVRAAEILLKKVVPDLSAIDHSGEVTIHDARELTDADLAAIAAGSRAGVAEASGDSSESEGVVH